MRKFFIRGVLGLVGATVLWLLVARQVSLLIDRFVTVRIKTLPSSPVSCGPDVLWFGDLPLDLRSAPARIDARLNCVSSGRVALSLGGQMFDLGSPNGPANAVGFEFAPDPGDQLSLTVERSFLSWPTPFDFNFMTGQSPSWKRHLYYRLRWTKASGVSLLLVWRFEQYFYGPQSHGWADGAMTREGSTGLLQADIFRR